MIGRIREEIGHVISVATETFLVLLCAGEGEDRSRENVDE